MGHAGALVFGETGTIGSKTQRLRGTGARVFDTVDGLIADCTHDFAHLRS
jgi:succinyl-CoA synthetase alpha subunit